MRRLQVTHDRKWSDLILYWCAKTSFYAERGSMLGSSNYWDSCQDHDVFGGIAYIVKTFFILLRS
jgi:hypothetical protein